MNPTEIYLKSVSAALGKGDSTEHTHRPALKAYLESMTTGVTATNEPRRIACGAPDYIVTKGEVPLGYIEAKDIGESLDKVEKSEQMARYKGSLGNLILTDYLEFRWFTLGEKRLTAKLGTLNTKGKITVDEEGSKEVLRLLSAFLKSQVPILQSPKELASRMAAIALMIRDIIKAAFKSEDGGGTLHSQLKGFREVLLHELTADQFADMYAQTICYGLFAARCAMPDVKPFTREKAPFLLPKTNPFLRKLFNDIAGPDLDSRIAWAVDDLAELLNRAKITTILKDFGKRTRQEDPVVHFYETFLAAYDPKLRESRGVYYTPEPVVSYIVRSVDHLLKTDFGLKQGLADASKVLVSSPSGESKEVHKVQVLDPATGTGTFLHGIIDQIHATFEGNEGLWSGYVSEHLLPRIFGFEVLMAPYAVAHLKLGLQLQETGYDFQSDERLRIYLTNTLEEAFEDDHGTAYFSKWLTEEAQAASKVKRDAPVMVVLGNPPYSGQSANKGQWIAKLLNGQDTMDPSHPKATGNYFEVDGKPLGERNPKWLNDDYVKFIRFAQWRIEQTGHGVLAFISNHGYLDNPTFRGMRQSLMQTFDEIYVLDLHGSSKKREASPDGSKDENVFDIQQGVAIGIFVKRMVKSGGTSKVHHAHLWGSRTKKYDWLNQHSLADTSWISVKHKKPFYLFTERDEDLASEYEKTWSIAALFPVNGVGMTTARDSTVIGTDDREILMRAEKFREIGLSDKEVCTALSISMKKGWNISKARTSLRAEGKNLGTLLKPILYRPFDAQKIFYHDSLVWRTAKQVMKHMFLGENLGLISARSNKSQHPDHFFCTRLITEAKTGESSTQSGLFPLYLYPEPTPGQLLRVDEHTSAPGSRRPNLSLEFIADLSAHLKLAFRPDGKGDLKKTFGPEDVFAYAYAIFHAPTYRTRYAEFLKVDFPRLPLTSDISLFQRLCGLGEALVGLHLMEREGTLPARFPKKGSNEVERRRYEPEEDGGRVWINATQYFSGVPEEVWSFHVGGYQICEKWLKDRKGQVLTHGDLTHYCRIVAALADTIRLMDEVDEAIEDCGGWPLT